MSSRFSVILLLAIASSLLACNSDRDRAGQTADPAPAVQHSRSSTAGIAWFEGSIEEAFATARAEKKPLFLYWGAQWCPPCHELKATIFRRDEFIAQSKLFIPVYLDGDTERAQKYGERFGMQGYPTVIIFDPQGVEITRIPGGLNIQQYMGVLELALNALHPVGDLLQAVRDGKQIRDDDWRLLASYSWDQDRGQALGEGSLYPTLQMLVAACPDRLVVAKSKLQMLAISSWAQETRRDESLVDEYAAQLQQILNNPELRRENLSLLIVGAAGIVKAMPTTAQGTAVREQVTQVLADAIGDPAIGVLTRLDALYGWVEARGALLGEDEPLPAGQQEWVRAQVDTLRPLVDSYQLHTALNSISEMYLSADMLAEARTVMLEGIQSSKQPYYFMSGMALLETRAGNPDAAIDWYKKAWEAAQGPATRVQWGTSYLLALLELRPDDLEVIAATGQTVLGELALQQEGLHQRSSGRMDRLSGSLLAWAEPAQGSATTRQQRQDVLHDLRGEMQKLCAGIAADDAPATCHSFLVAM